MTNAEKYREVFIAAFGGSAEVEKLKYQSIYEWDSVGHIQLMAAL
jgi:acyl carrier protein